MGISDKARSLNVFGRGLWSTATIIYIYMQLLLPVSALPRALLRQLLLSGLEPATLRLKAQRAATVPSVYMQIQLGRNRYTDT